MLLHNCYYVLSHRIGVLTSLIVEDMDIQQQAFDCGSVESLVPITRVSLFKKYHLKSIRM